VTKVLPTKTFQSAQNVFKISASLSDIGNQFALPIDLKREHTLSFNPASYGVQAATYEANTDVQGPDYP